MSKKQLEDFALLMSAHPAPWDFDVEMICIRDANEKLVDEHILLNGGVERDMRGIVAAVNIAAESIRIFRDSSGRSATKH